MSDYKTMPVAYDGPGTIYLQWRNPDRDLGVMWSQDKVHDDDVEYVTAAQLTLARQRITDLEGQLAEAQRREGLLRAAIESSVENQDRILDYLIANNLPAAVEVSNLIETAALQAAIDGGALEGG